MTLFEYLTLRSEYEDLTLNLKVPGDLKPGTVDNMRWYVEEGAGRNKRKKDNARALEIAKEVVDELSDNRI